METIVGTALGAFIAASAMLLNSVISARHERERQSAANSERMLEKEIDDLSALYEDVLHSSDRLIRKKGRDNEAELEKFYRLEVKLSLHSTEEIRKAFKEVRGVIVDMAKNLPDLPEEFIPKFEEDYDRQRRLEARKEAERAREETAKKYMPNCWEKHAALAKLLRQDLAARREGEKTDE
jgi:hypothetical protein